MQAKAAYVRISTDQSGRKGVKSLVCDKSRYLGYRRLLEDDRRSDFGRPIGKGKGRESELSYRRFNVFIIYVFFFGARSSAE